MKEESTLRRACAAARKKMRLRERYWRWIRRASVDDLRRRIRWRIARIDRYKYDFLVAHERRILRQEIDAMIAKILDLRQGKIP